VTIGEVARRAGVRASTIRYYEAVGVLPAPPGTSRQRRYDHTALHRLAIVRFATHVGFSLPKIQQLLAGPATRPPTERWRRMAHDRLASIDATLHHAQAIKQLLLGTLTQTCPKLVEHGVALDSNRGDTVTREPPRPIRSSR
jgi:MerR family redox-sensitive transcriptional activator SoxR